MLPRGVAVTSPGPWSLFLGGGLRLGAAPEDGELRGRGRDADSGGECGALERSQPPVDAKGVVDAEPARGVPLSRQPALFAERAASRTVAPERAASRTLGGRSPSIASAAQPGAAGRHVS